MSQTTINVDMAQGFAGQLADLNQNNYVRSASLEEPAAIPFGVGLKRGTLSDDGYLLPSAAADILEGVAVHSHAVNTIGLSALAGALGILPAQKFNIMRKGTIWVVPEVVVTRANPVFCRFATSPNAGAPIWLPGTAYALGALVLLGGNVYTVTTAGVSGGSGPSGLGAGIVDGTVIWSYTRNGLSQRGSFGIANDAFTGAAWAPSPQTYTVGQYRSNGGNVYECLVAGTAAASGGPAGTAASGIVDGTAQWGYVAPAAAAAALVKGGKWLSTGAAVAGNPVILEFDDSVAAN
jgi:hypothetical protein